MARIVQVTRKKVASSGSSIWYSKHGLTANVRKSIMQEEAELKTYCCLLKRSCAIVTSATSIARN